MSIRIVLVVSPGPRQVHEEVLTLPDNCAVWQALLCSALLVRLGMPVPPAQGFGVWGHKVGGDHRLCDGDRLELYRPLTVDPKVARRARFEAQGAGTAGLFARRRAGAKAGY